MLRFAFQTRERIAGDALCVGPSSGGAVAAAIKYSQKIAKAANIVVIMPDNGRAYLSKAFNTQWLRDNGLLDK